MKKKIKLSSEVDHQKNALEKNQSLYIHNICNQLRVHFQFQTEGQLFQFKSEQTST